tara:strand:- start:54 stop:224 length:171 start_codon:yes stop_codon:yes gene_type:complete
MIQGTRYDPVSGNSALLLSLENPALRAGSEKRLCQKESAHAMLSDVALQQTKEEKT